MKRSLNYYGKKGFLNYNQGTGDVGLNPIGAIMALWSNDSSPVYTLTLRLILKRK